MDRPAPPQTPIAIPGAVGDTEPKGWDTLSEDDRLNLIDEDRWDALPPGDQDALLERASAAGVITDVPPEEMEVPVGSTVQGIDFPAHFRGPVERGAKITTIRPGIRDYRLGMVLLDFQDGGPLREADITGLSATQVRHLDTEAALNDGFPSLAEMLATLRDIYPDLTADTPVTVVFFALRPGQVKEEDVFEALGMEAPVDDFAPTFGLPGFGGFDLPEPATTEPETDPGLGAAVGEPEGPFDPTDRG